MARDLHDGHIHPRGHFCGSNCPKHKPEGVSAANHRDALVIAHCAPDRECERCGSVKLGVLEYDSFLRKECLTCGSTGPFIPLPKDGPHGY